MFLSLVLALATALQASESKPASGPCALAPQLREALQNRFGSSRVLTPADLFEDERGLFLADHPSACPGLRTGKFFGAKERHAIAIVLLGVGPKQDVRLIVARPALLSWVLLELETMERGSTAVVWKEGPGAYTDRRTAKTLKSPNDVVVLTGYESWQRVYVWRGRAFEVLQTSD